jgi:hypothetical protein
MAGTQYVQLVASLPALGPPLAAKSVPINRVQLQRRLHDMLTPDHLSELETAASMLAWPRQPLPETDADFVRKADKVLPTLRSATLRRLMQDQFELRTIMAALRRRHAGQDAPAAGTIWGYGRYVRRLREHWREPGLGLERTLKWVLPARDKLEKDDAVGLERILLEAAWRQADRLADTHDFDFEAVVLYVFRWDLLDRWIRYDVEAAATRFGTLAAEALDAAPMPLKADPDLMEAAT